MTISLNRRAAARYRRAIGAGVAACAVVVALAASTAGRAGGIFEPLAGTWRGEGQVTLTGGKTEHLSCKAYYTPKDSGAGLGLALACASAGNKIDLRASLASEGATITGNWEERSFNSTGTVHGTSGENRIDLTIKGTLEATMSITMEGANQLISISTNGTGFKSVDLELLRL